MCFCSTAGGIRPSRIRPSTALTASAPLGRSRSRGSSRSPRSRSGSTDAARETRAVRHDLFGRRPPRLGLSQEEIFGLFKLKRPAARHRLLVKAGAEYSVFAPGERALLAWPAQAVMRLMPTDSSVTVPVAPGSIGGSISASGNKRAARARSSSVKLTFTILVTGSSPSARRHQGIVAGGLGGLGGAGGAATRSRSPCTVKYRT